MTTKKDNTAKLSFEYSLKELEEIVKELETGNLNLETSIEKYQRGTTLKKQCEKRLVEAKMKVDKIIKGSDGSIKAEKTEIV